MTLSADQIFVFAGAGVSRSMPSALPMFDQIRDGILTDLKLPSYVQDGSKDGNWKVAAGLAPEPFMLALAEAEIGIEGWLAEVLRSDAPNAAHRTLAHLAESGARVWTVNFDTLIEDASQGRCKRIAWPEDPGQAANLMKPHGTIGGRLIVTAKQVLAPLAEPWLERLKADVTGRVVIFVGYSGRDLDFQPIWDEVLTSARQVLWFDMWDDGRPRDEARKRSLLPRTDKLGLLSFPEPPPPPAGLADDRRNPSWAFVAWCQEHQLSSIDALAAQAMFDCSPPPRFPALPGRTDWARPAVQGLLGDYLGERRSYLALAARSPDRRRAARAIGISLVNHGGSPVAAILAPAMLLPPLGRAGQFRVWANRKRVTVWSRTAQHDAVLRATSQLSDKAVSTALILRAESLRITGSLDLAAATANQALSKARLERHPVRVAHAAFQKCLALLWAERVDEARLCLAADVEPSASVAANRWVAWMDFLSGGIAVRTASAGDKDTAYALYRLKLSEDRFRSEALLDGVVSVMTARLAVYRLSDDDDLYRRELAMIVATSAKRYRGQRYYTSRSDFTAGSILIDRAEFARAHEHRLDLAWQRYERASASRYPLHAALGYLGLALIQAERGERPGHAEAAVAIGARIGCRLVVERAWNLADGPAERDLREVYFC